MGSDIDILTIFSRISHRREAEEPKLKLPIPLLHLSILLCLPKS